MQLLKSILIVIVITLVIGYLILGHDEFWFNANGWKAETKNVVRGVGPADVQFQKLEAEIREAEEKIYELEAAARMAAGEANAMARQVEEREAELQHLREQVSIGRQLLQERQSEYVVSDHTLSLHEMVELVNFRADEYQRKASQLDNARSGAEERRATAQRLSAKSVNLAAMIESERLALVQLKHDYQVARFGRDTANLISEINLSSDVFADGPYATTKRGLQEEVHRLRAEAQHKMRWQDMSVAHEIDLRDPASSQDMDSILRDIDRKVDVTPAGRNPIAVLDSASVVITE